MFATIDDIRKANRRLGHHWFTPETMRFFRTRVHDQVYGGRYFVTSERSSMGNARCYTVRKANPDGDIDTVSGFGAYTTSRAAHAAAKQFTGERH